MDDQLPSKTAFRVAMRRAAHQRIDRPVVFDDPLAVRMVEVDAADPFASPLQADLAREQHPIAMRLRAFLAVRSRFAEDELAKAVASGATQYVILGAGLDTFAYRNPHPGLRVFEVDHPATQRWKQKRLADAGIPVPASVIFAPVDFEKQIAADVLDGVGFKHDRVTFFSWLGVVPYLSDDAFAHTLGWIGSMPRESAVVFDYATDPAALGAAERAAFDELARRVASAGEPFRLFRAPERLAAELHHAGFRDVLDLSAPAINARYFANRSDGLGIAGTVAHLMLART
jgi:methyltransferase (TIGR00027 family)